MLRIVFNTKRPTSPASEFYRAGMGRLPEVTCDHWDAYEHYDVALFMAFGEDLESIAEAKAANPDLRVGVIDPRNGTVGSFSEAIDFLVCDSIEMQDFLAQFGMPVFRYLEYPDITPIAKKHSFHKPVIISYHGNLVHLEGMEPRITSALERLGERHSLELWAMYDMERLGKWRIGVPTGITTRHCQWSPEAYRDVLAESDIGIVPGLMPIRRIDALKKRSIVSEKMFLDAPDDYLLKFKMPSNAGRIIVFQRLGIPVVADMFPAALQYIRDGETGYLAYSTAAWYAALEGLIVSPELRQTMSDRLSQEHSTRIDYDVQNASFVTFLDDLLAGLHPRRPNIPNADGTVPPMHRAQTLLQRHCQRRWRQAKNLLSRLSGGAC